MKKKLCIVSIIFIMMMSLGGCGKKEHVVLSIWGADISQELLQEMVEDFKEYYGDEAEFDITVGVESEESFADSAEHNPDAVADVFCFPDDQYDRLMAAGILAPVTEDREDIIEENGGADSVAIKSCVTDGQLYAYPMTASNGYFLYYNADFYTPEDVTSLDRILEIADDCGRKVSMDWSSGWYIFSFFQGAGLTLTTAEDGIHNQCNWNATDTRYTGVQVAEAMLAVAEHESFANITDDEFRAGVLDGSIIAGISGAWNLTTVESAWGDAYRAVKLPSYTLNGEQVQMGSFMGYKFVGVNADSEYPEWSMRLARWITNEDNQMRRFEVMGECPSNIHAAQTDIVQASPVMSALTAQAEYAVQQKVGSAFWTPATVFGTVMAAGNPDNRDLQELLDELVTEAGSE